VSRRQINSCLTGVYQLATSQRWRLAPGFAGCQLRRHGVPGARLC